MTKSQRLRTISYGFLLLNVLCWGGLFIITKPALTYTTPYFLLFYRFTLAALLVSPILVYYLLQHVLRKKLVTIILVETLGTVIYLSLLYQGLAKTSAIEASMLAGTLPIFIVLVSVFLFQEKQTRREWTGLSVSLIGVLLIAALPLINGNAKLLGISVGGSALIITANIIASFYAILSKKHYDHLPKFFPVSIGFILGSLAFGLLSLKETGMNPQLWRLNILQDFEQPSVWIAVASLAILGSIIGLTAYIKGQQHVEASEASLFYYLHPFVYLPLGVILLGEPIVPLQIIGLIIIFVGVLYSEQPFSRRRS